MPKNPSNVSSTSPITKEAFLKQKNLPLDLFATNDLPNLNDPIEVHSAFIYNHILSRLENEAHGIQHANRVASYVVVWANFYRRHQHVFENQKNYKKNIDDYVSIDNTHAYQLLAAVTKNFNEDLLQVCKIAGLLHDTGREGDGKDEWDKDSAVLCYLYLRALGLDVKMACHFAGVIANKEMIPPEEVLQISDNGEISWRKIVLKQNASSDSEDLAEDLDAEDSLAADSDSDADEKAEKNSDPTYHYLLHDGDSLDILRARANFKAKKTAFGNTLNTGHPNPDETQAFNELAALITETRSLIDTQGDTYLFTKPEVKSYYENEHGYERHVKSMTRFPMLSALYNNGKLMSKEESEKLTLIDDTSYDPEAGLTELNVMRAMREGKLYSRSLVIPSAESRKEITYQDGTIGKETLAQLELRKLARRKNTKTSSSKANNLDKYGNPRRSISMLAYGSEPFADSGYLIIDPPLDKIVSIFEVDADTGFHKKKGVEFTKLTKIQKKEYLNDLLDTLKEGGSTRYYGDFPSHHNEVICNLDEYHAVYFTNDPTARNQLDIGDARAVHHHAPFLKAIYEQYEYKHKFGKTLPIFEYAGIANKVRKVNKEEYTQERILAMWKEAIQDCIKRLSMSHEGLMILAQNDPELIKVNVIYGLNELSHTADFISKLQSVDINYPTHLKDSINNIAKETLDDAMKLLTAFQPLLQAAIKDDLETFTHLSFMLPLSTLAENEKYLLMTTLFKNNSEKVLAFILNQDKDKSFVNAANFFDSTLLLDAIIIKDIERVKYLIDHGADQNLEKDNVTPLMVAIALNHAEIVELLLTAKADINHRNPFGVTPLYHALNLQHKKIAKILLNAGADPNDYSDKLVPPIMVAISNNKLVQKLVDCGAKVNISPLVPIETIKELVIWSDDKEMLAKFAHDDKVMITPLQFAMFLQQFGSVFTLMQAGAGFVKNADGKMSLSTDCMPGKETLGQMITARYIKGFANSYLKGIEYFVEHLTESDSIDEIAENPQILALLIGEGFHKTLLNIAEHYYEKHQKLLLYTKAPSHWELMESTLLKQGINQGLLCFPLDQDGRVQYSEYDLTKIQLIVNRSFWKLEKEADYTKFNLDNLHFKYANFEKSQWRILKSDKITFTNCNLDGFSTTPDSDLSNVEFINPIFSTKNAAYKAASLFPTIPLFIVRPRYINEVKMLLRDGKSLEFNNELLSRLYKLLELRCLKLSAFLINHFKEKNTHLTELAEPTALLDKQLRLRQHVDRLETQIEHVGKGKRGRTKKNILTEQLLFFKQHRQVELTEDIEQKRAAAIKPTNS